MCWSCTKFEYFFFHWVSARFGVLLDPSVRVGSGCVTRGVSETLESPLREPHGPHQSIEVRLVQRLESSTGLGWSRSGHLQIDLGLFLYLARPLSALSLTVRSDCDCANKSGSDAVAWNCFYAQSGPRVRNTGVHQCVENSTLVAKHCSIFLTLILFIIYKRKTNFLFWKCSLYGVKTYNIVKLC